MLISISIELMPLCDFVAWALLKQGRENNENFSPVMQHSASEYFLFWAAVGLSDTAGFLRIFVRELTHSYSLFLHPLFLYIPLIQEKNVYSWNLNQFSDFFLHLKKDTKERQRKQTYYATNNIKCQAINE